MIQTFTADTAFDGESLVRDAALIVDGARIVACGPESTIGTSGPTRRFDGGFIMPGFVDAHNHLGLTDGAGDEGEQYATPVEELLERARRSARINLESGVTTLQELGEPHYIDLKLRDEIATGKSLGPRIRTAGPWITPSHGHGAYPVGPDIADGAGEVTKAVRRHIRAGVDMIKLMISGGISDSGSLDASYYSRAEITAAIDEAHRFGIAVTAHCYGGEGVRIAVDAGIDRLEHVARLTDDSDIQQIVASETGVVFTNGIIFEDERVSSTLPVAFKRLYEQGALIALGADEIHGHFAFEVELAVRYGADPVDALRMATSRGARLCGVAESVGSLDPGHYADFIVLDGDPVEDIKRLAEVKVVCKDGVLIRDEER